MISVLGSVLSCILINPLVDAISRRNEVEKAEKVGQGIGNDNEGCKKLLDTNEQYAKLYNRLVGFILVYFYVIYICICIYPSICGQQLFRDLSPHQHRTEYHDPHPRIVETYISTKAYILKGIML